jgi:hypothetical protein
MPAPATQRASWFYASDGKTFGSVTEAELEALALNGNVHADTLVAPLQLGIASARSVFRFDHRVLTVTVAAKLAGLLSENPSKNRRETEKVRAPNGHAACCHPRTPRREP